MPALKHLPADADAGAIVAALEQDGAVILDDVISPEFIAALREETDPYMEHTRNGEDPFVGFSTTRTGGLLIRSEKCRELIEHATILKPCHEFLGPFASGCSCISLRSSEYDRAKPHRPSIAIDGLGANTCRISSRSSTPSGR